MLAGLISFVDTLPGHEVAIKFVYRCPECPVGKKYSLHKKSLAADIDLYIDGKYQRTGKAHKPLHDWWDNAGGGENRLIHDMNHYAYIGKEVE